MFDKEAWRSQIAEKLATFARNPNQDIMLAGTSSLLIYFAARSLEPFLEAFQSEPVAAVLALAELHQGPGADHIVRRAGVLRYQATRVLEREIGALPHLRVAIEQLIVGLNTINLARQRLNSSRDEWLRTTLLRELHAYDSSEFSSLRRLLNNSDWHSRYEAIRSLRQRRGNYTSADLVLLHDGLHDGASHVRAASARMLGQFADVPPPVVVRTLLHVAIYDCDQETRYAAARALGGLRERITSPQLLDQLTSLLSDNDRFYRSAAVMVLGQLGELASSPMVVSKLTELLQDSDYYVREAAARTLGCMGSAAATSEVLQALTLAVQDSDSNVHEAAVEALMRLRDQRPLTAKQINEPQTPAINRPSSSVAA
jgi:FOG: HEAT repeat